MKADIGRRAPIIPSFMRRWAVAAPRDASSTPPPNFDPLHGSTELDPLPGPPLRHVRRHLKRELRLWAPQAFRGADLTCTYDHVDGDCCSWYHKVWPVLRVLDVVSSPSWHHDFYAAHLVRELERHDHNRVLVAGTADFSMLGYVLAAGRTRRRLEVTVVDQCLTPLDGCKWYFPRSYGDNGPASIRTIGATLPLSSESTYQLITTDALLTRFDRGAAAKIVANWSDLLEPGGAVVTTIRLHPRETKSDSGQADFVQRAIAQFNSSMLRDTIEPREEVYDAIKAYAQNMTSFNLGDVNDLRNLFHQSDLAIEHIAVAQVEGEFNRTQYARVVARRT